MHQDLVPYANLPEPEKEYDRKTAMEALKAIVSMGYGIENKG
ncbi:MAG: RyR domain-containing protein [Syntrophobacteraceae bacterium]